MAEHVTKLKFPIKCLDCGTELTPDMKHSKGGVVFWECVKCKAEELKDEVDEISFKTARRIEQFQIDVIKVENKREGREWLKGPKITTAEIRNKTGCIESCNIFDNEVAVPKAVLKFGKHKGKTYQEVLKADRQYFEWACMNIRGFTDAARKEVPDYFKSL